MTTQDIANRVASNLGDPTFAQFTYNDIVASIQDGYNIICAKTLCRQKSANFPQIGNQVYYRFADYYPDLLAVSAIFNYNTNRWLIPVDRRQFDLLRWDWELMVGEPRWFDPQNWRYTAIVPHNGTQVSAGFQVFYRAQANQLFDNSVPEIQNVAIQALEEYATKDQFESIREFTKAREYRALYRSRIPEIKKLTRQIAFADKQNVLSPSQVLGTYAFTGINDNMWVGDETPQGTIDGTNVVFTLAGVPSPTSTLLLIWNGVVQIPGVNFTLVGNTIIFAPLVPQVNPTPDTIRCWYQT